MVQDFWHSVYMGISMYMYLCINYHLIDSQLNSMTPYEPRRQTTCLLGFRSSPTQIGLYGKNEDGWMLEISGLVCREIVLSM